MRIGPTEILDTYAEAFGARYARVIVTAADDYWLDAALRPLAGYGSSVIGCDAEVGVERLLAPAETPDGRPGGSVLMFHFTTEALGHAVANRVGQCVLTCPTTACFNGLVEAVESVPLGRYLRYFGDGFEMRDQRHGRCCWRIPVMDGEFIVEETAGASPGIAGGNVILQAESPAIGLAAARRASAAVACVPGVVAPFPGGVCRSGSKVGSKYKKLVASTADAYSPVLRDRVETQLVPGAAVAYEIVIDGIDEAAVAAAMRAGIEAAAGEGIPVIGAGNYGGKLGKYPIRLHDLFR